MNKEIRNSATVSSDEYMILILRTLVRPTAQLIMGYNDFLMCKNFRF